MDANPDDRAALARAAAKQGIGHALTYAPSLTEAGRAALIHGARAAILPVVSEAVGLPVIEALACGTPVVASSVGALPELVGAAGLLVEPRDPVRLAVALQAIWADDRVHGGVAAAARERAESDRRTWADVADDTREIYAEVGAGRPSRRARDLVGDPAGAALGDLVPHRRRDLAVLDDDRRAGRQDLHEGLARGEGDLVAGRVEELGRGRQ